MFKGAMLGGQVTMVMMVMRVLVLVGCRGGCGGGPERDGTSAVALRVSFSGRKLPRGSELGAWSV